MTPATLEILEERYTIPPVEEIFDTDEQIREKQQRVRELCVERNAVMLAHHYQRPEVQEAADFVADSLRLSQHAAKTLPQGRVSASGVIFVRLASARSSLSRFPVWRSAPP